MTRPALVGIVVKASVQPIESIKSTENADGGFNTESRYRLRLASGWPTAGGIPGAQSQVE